MKNYSFIFSITILLFIGCKKETKPFYFSSEEEFIANNEGLSDSAKLGKLIFFDKNLSNPVGTSYAVFAPNLHAEVLRGVWEEVGGFFLDGRAEFLVRQPFEPMTKPTEMNMHDLQSIVKKVEAASYFPLYKKLFGTPAPCDSQVVVFNLSLCLEKFEMSFQVNPFTSKFDFYLKGQYTFTEQEKRGMQLFNDSTKAKCALYHLTTSTSYASTDKILFTDYSYDNTGLPKNPLSKTTAIDSGVAKAEMFVKIEEIGKFKTPTLRNVEISSKFAHPEVPATVNKEDMGNLKLNQQEISDIIAFLKTLTDGYKPIVKNKN